MLDVDCPWLDRHDVENGRAAVTRAQAVGSSRAYRKIVLQTSGPLLVVVPAEHYVRADSEKPLMGRAPVR